MTTPSTPSPPRRLPFSVLAKPTGSACNLDCAYCFFLSKELLYDHQAQRMSEELLAGYLANLFDAQPDGQVQVAWQGGEPTLRGLDFFRLVVDLAEQLRRPGQQVEHVIQTNGTLLDDEWAEFLAEHHFLVGVSIDGPAHLHDTFRVSKTGAGTHAQVVRGWDVLQAHQVDSNILCTVNAANQHHPLDVYRYFRDELGARYLQFIPIVERVPADQLALAERGWRAGERGRRSLLYRQHGDRVTSRSASPAAYGEFLIAIFDEWVGRDVGDVFVQDFDSTLGNIFGRPSLCVHSPECGNAVVVEHNGDVYACDHFVEPGYLLGNTAEGSLQVMLQSPAQREFGRSKRTGLPADCRSCPVLWACHGGCPKDRFVTTADGEPGLSYLCAGYRRFYAHSRPTLQDIARLIRAGRPAADILAEHQAS